jgi:hypothetical protein
VPNFFSEVKGPDGSLAVAGRQIIQDCASGARGVQSLESHGQPELVYDNNAYTIGSIYHGGTLKMYTTYPTQPTGSGNRPEYYTHQLNGWLLTSNPETFRQGATWYRNGVDLAKEWRDEMIEAANERAQGIYTESQSSTSSGFGETSVSATGAALGSDTSEDELALDEPISRSLRKRPRME